MQNTTSARLSIVTVTTTSLSRLLRITAYVLRFVSNLRRSLAERTVNELTSLEIEQADNRWIKNIEVNSFWQRNRILKEDNATNLCTAQFGLYLDDNQIIRVRHESTSGTLQTLRLLIYLCLDASDTFGTNNYIVYKHRRFPYGISYIHCTKKTSRNHYVR